jgi:hypothetical protein
LVQPMDRETMKAVLYVRQKTALILFSFSQWREHTRVHSINSSAHICMFLLRRWIKFVFKVNIFLWFALIVSAHLKLVFLLLIKRKAYLLSYVHIHFLTLYVQFHIFVRTT